MKLTSLVILLSIFNFQVMAQKPSQAKIDALTKKISFAMHTDWRKNHQAEKGVDTPREKAIPLATGETAESALIRLASYQTTRKDKATGESVNTIRINEKGELIQDINQEASKIVPALNLKLNGRPARAYADYVLHHSFKTRLDFVEGSEAVHKVWMIENDWQRNDHPELFEEYAKLTNKEKIKDLIILKSVLDQVDSTISSSIAFKNYYIELSK